MALPQLVAPPATAIAGFASEHQAHGTGAPHGAAATSALAWW
jgi:hypothetical protein